jgi:hypothetical protein
MVAAVLMTRPGHSPRKQLRSCKQGNGQGQRKPLKTNTAALLVYP